MKLRHINSILSVVILLVEYSSYNCYVPTGDWSGPYKCLANTVVADWQSHCIDHCPFRPIVLFLTKGL